MIAFGSSITGPETYERHAKAGIQLAAEPDSEILAIQATGSISSSYNLISEHAAKHDDLEALVLVHQDAEIIDPEFCAKLRRVLRDPEVAVVGCVGAVGVSSIAWWEGSVTWSSAVYRYREAGGGDLSGAYWNGRGRPAGEVDTVHGFMLALSPWTVRNVHFDEAGGQKLHGYDFDLCQQVRTAGRKVIVADLAVAHHHSLDLVTDPEIWAIAHMRTAEKWEGRMPNSVVDGDWKQRARRGEADAAAARLRLASTQLQAAAHADRDDRRLHEVTASRSWRLTEPLRRLNAFRVARKGRPSLRARPSRYRRTS